MSPWAPPGVVIDEAVAWERRSRRFRKQHRFCELCERRYAYFGPFILKPRLQVHHRQGRGVRSAVGFEDDAELMTLCVPCHQRITAKHRRLARQAEIRTKDGYGHDTPKYSHIIAEVTDAARPRYLARAFRRMLIGLPTQA